MRPRGLFGRLRLAIGPLLGLGLTAYFVFHAVEGDRGVLAYLHLQEDVDKISAESVRIARKRRDLERDVAALKAPHIDRDLLEERVREVLGYAHEDEVIIFHNADNIPR